MPAISAGAAGLGAAGAIGGASAGGSSGWSNSSGTSLGLELGGSNSASSSYDWSNAYGYGYSNDVSEGWSDSWGESYSENYGRTYGREASAQDVLNAAIANQVQRDLWSDQAAFNAKEAEKDRMYQAYMSNTAYQRAVRDLRAAGLNPILAVGNMGASTPQGSTATAGLATSAKANAYAESTSGGYSRSNSGSHAYNYSKGNSYNYNQSNSRGASSSYSQGWNRGVQAASNKAESEWTNNIRETVGKLGDLFGTLGNSGKNLGEKIYNYFDNKTYNRENYIKPER